MTFNSVCFGVLQVLSGVFDCLYAHGVLYMCNRVCRQVKNSIKNYSLSKCPNGICYLAIPSLFPYLIQRDSHQTHLTHIFGTQDISKILKYFIAELLFDQSIISLDSSIIITIESQLRYLSVNGWGFGRQLKVNTNK